MNLTIKHPAAMIAFIAAAVCASSTYAETTTVQLGWMDITPCSRVVWRNNGIFGTPSPTVQSAPQRVYAYADVNTPSGSQVQNDVQQCAIQGAAAAGLASLATSPAGAMPAFKAAFSACMASRSADWTGFSLRVSGGQCQW